MLAQVSPVVITGLGAVSALGHGTEALAAGLAAGRDGIRPLPHLVAKGFAVAWGGVVDDAGGASANVGADRCVGLAVEAAREALGGPCTPDQRLALVLGTSLGGHLRGESTALPNRGGQCGRLRAPHRPVPTACASSTNALGLAKDLLDWNLADRVLAGGTDLLTPEVFAGFYALGLLSPSPCAPFSEPVGTTLGEGSGFVLLDRASRAEERGARVCSAALGAFGPGIAGMTVTGTGIPASTVVGWTYPLGSYSYILLSNNATATGTVTLTFNSNQCQLDSNNVFPF